MIQFFKNRKIGYKLNAIIGVLVVLILILGSIAIMGFEEIDEYNQELNTNTTMPLFQLMSLKEAFQSQRIRLRDMMMADTVETRTNAYNRLKEAGSRLEKLDKDFREQLEKRPEDSLQSLYKDYTTYYEQYVKVIEKAEQLTKEGKIKEAMFYIGEKGEGGIISAYARDSIDAMMNNKLQEQEVKRVNINQLIVNLDRLMMISIAVIIMLAIILGNILAKMITKPIKILMKETNKLAESNMDVHVDIQTKDEIGMLAGAFNKMTTNISDTLYEINTSSDEVSAGSKQIAYASQALAQGATEQASAIEELTVSIGEVADQTKQNALNAMQASSLAQGVKESAQKGSYQMKDMVVAIKQMNESAQGISKIIKVIDDIAFQTNILALNAAVEAARAGQYGKGFAVVAEEVRNLAARSASAAKETTTMIEDAIEKTQNSTHIVGETEKSLVGIVEGVMQVAELVEKISIASNDQATSTVQINKGIEQVSSVIQSNSATAEETASSSEELSNQAEILKRTVSKFKLREQKEIAKKDIQKKITLEIEKASYKQKY